MEKKVWGKKTLETKSDTLQRINIRRLLCVIREEIEEFFAEDPKIFKKNKGNEKEIKSKLSGYLSSIKKNRGINDYKVETYDDTFTWTMAYPNVIKRLWAIFFYKFLYFNLERDKPRWYHHLFPFKVKITSSIDYGKLWIDWWNQSFEIFIDLNTEQDIVDRLKPWFLNEDKEPDNTYDWETASSFFNENLPPTEWFTRWLEENPPQPKYEAYMKFREEKLGVNMYVTPMKALDSINLNFTVPSTEGIAVSGEEL